MYKIMFVCHGNICRSPMAEFVLKDIVKKQGREKEFSKSEMEFFHSIKSFKKEYLKAILRKKL